MSKDWEWTREDEAAGDEPPMGIIRARGISNDSVYINQKLWHTPAAVLDEIDRLESQIERMQNETVILHAVFNSGMPQDEKSAITYQSGPYEITKLTVGIRQFVKTLIAKAGEQPKEKDHG
jgi:hypothetical protein